MSEQLQKLINLRDEITTKLKIAKTEMSKLAQDEKVKAYIEQSANVGELETALPELDLEVRKEEIKNCNHIWVTSKIHKEWDGHRTHNYEYHVCVKCGLDTHARERVYDGQFATQLDYVMNEILNEPGKGIKADVICSYDLATGIYSGILRNHPKITDEQAVKYLIHALQNIRTNEVSDDVKEKRVKRLGLSPKFKRWNASDVISGN